MTNPAYALAEADTGVVEWREGHNPKVVQYFADVGHGWVQDDETAWCAAFVGAMLKRAGMPHTGKLNARSYLDWGNEVDLHEAREGDIVVFWRGSPDDWRGHVGFFVRQDGDHIYVLGGNQLNAVNVLAYPASRLLGVRRSPVSRVPSRVAVISGEPRATPASSRTVQASAVQVASGAGAAVSSIAMLEGTSQVVALAFAGAVILMALWIMRERLKKWANGDR